MRKTTPANGGPKARGIDTVIWGLAAAAGVAIVLVTVAVHLAPTPWMQVVSSFVTFFASVYLSFVVTRHYARVTSREELRRLAEAAGSRIFLLSLQMRQLASELAGSEPADEVTKVAVDSIAAQIERLAAQADLSVEDLERIADIDLPLPAMRDAAQTRVEAATKRERIKCPHCDHEVEVTISTAGGTTRHGRCPNCKRGFVIHRLGDGTLKVGHTEYFRIDCPNPSCKNEIGIRPRETEWGIIIRNCFECFARVSYDLDNRKVQNFVVETPLTVAADKVEITTNGQRRVSCPSCGYVLTLLGYINSRGQELMSCPRCTKLVAVQSAAAG
jgi:uncharacterized C2H2 Zn-finger protein